MQIRVSEELWKYQLVRYKGKVYCLTRLGFGLNSAPRIMSKILKTVLSLSEDVLNGTSSYIDDIFVNTNKVSSQRVVTHLCENGLESKPPELLEGGSALGLKLKCNAKGVLVFSRGNEVPVITGKLTRRELFSMCGKLVGHYPVAGWLRTSCSYVKRIAEGSSWDDFIGDPASSMISEMIEMIHGEDPVQGEWQVSNSKSGKVWCDASDLALGVVVEIGGVVVEDAAWLRKKKDYNHINVAELEGVLKGINLAVKWGLKDIQVITDSVTVHRWIELTLSEERKVKTKGAAEIIIKRRLGVLKSLIEELGLKIRVEVVPSKENKADNMTRVKKSWLSAVKRSDDEYVVALNLKDSHEVHHMGVDRSLYLARKLDPGVSREAVKAVVRACQRCQRIDPAPVAHTKGQLSMDKNWCRVAIDVTHYQNKPYLSLVDCGPSRFAIWREMRNERTEEIIGNLNQIFSERGPVRQILMDNATALKSEKMMVFLSTWNIEPWYRSAYRASGNGIVERHHRTIKSMAEKSNVNPVQAVFWYNVSPKRGQDPESVPQKGVHSYEWRLPWEVMDMKDGDHGQAIVREGDEVWLKPPGSKCTTEWSRGKVTKVNSSNNVEVDGMPRHILDMRHVYQEQEPEEQQDVDHENAELEDQLQEPEEVQNEEHECVGLEDHGRRYPQRERRPPPWLSDYVQY